MTRIFTRGMNSTIYVANDTNFKNNKPLSKRILKFIQRGPGRVSKLMRSIFTLRANGANVKLVPESMLSHFREDLKKNLSANYKKYEKKLEALTHSTDKLDSTKPTVPPEQPEPSPSSSARQLGASIKNNLNLENDDLLYGLNNSRYQTVKNSLISVEGMKPTIFDGTKIPSLFIDMYNLLIARAIISYANLNALGSGPSPIVSKLYDMKKNGRKAEDIFPNSEEIMAEINNKELYNKNRFHKPLLEAYLNLGEVNKKFDIKSIYTENYENGLKEWVGTIFNASPELFIKRGCKMGLAIAASDKEKMKIHFILDDINMSPIISKDESFVGAELRYLYRNWSRLKDKVHFYIQDKEVDAPWVQDPDLWRKYQPKSKVNPIDRGRDAHC